MGIILVLDTSLDTDLDSSPPNGTSHNRYSDTKRRTYVRRNNAQVFHKIHAIRRIDSTCKRTSAPNRLVQMCQGINPCQCKHKI